MSRSNNDISSTRPRRTIKRSQRAEEIAQSGEDVAGLPSPSSPIHREHTFSADTSDPIDGSTDADRSASMPDTDRRPGTTSDAGHSLPSFKWPRFCIYDWPQPRPTDFLNLAESRKVWKSRVDDQEKSRDINDGSDDWYEFSGIRADYNRVSDANDGEYRMEHVIAGTFMKRAKRSFWAAKRWEDFEFQERTSNSEAWAKAERDPKRRELLAECALDNNFRLLIFDRLKRRLCEEIWLQEYQEAPGLVRFKMPKKDSKVSNFNDALYASPGQPQSIVEPTATEREDGVTGWQGDGKGYRQPLYGEETELPNGMGNFMRDMNARREVTTDFPSQEGGTSRAHDDRDARGRELGIRTHQSLGARTAEELAMMGPGFESSDEEKS